MPPARQHADLLVLGHSLEGALCAALLRKRGHLVLWAGKPADAPAPALFPGLSTQPSLSRVLDEVGLRTEIERQLVPVSLQLLTPGERLTLSPDERSLSLEALDEAPRFRPFALGGWKKRREAARREMGSATRAETLLASLFDEDTAFRLAASPRLLKGGLSTLRGLVWRRFATLGGRQLDRGLEHEAPGFSFGFTAGTVELSGGEVLGARALVLAADAEELSHLPLPARLRAKVGAHSEPALWHLALQVKTRGLPLLLAPVALLDDGEAPLLIERRPVSEGLEELALFQRSSEAPDPKHLIARLLAVLPFFDRHLGASTSPQRVPFSARCEGGVPRPARTVLLARSDSLRLSGAEGAALYAEGLSELAERLLPREKTGAGTKA